MPLTWKSVKSHSLLNALQATNATSSNVHLSTRLWLENSLPFSLSSERVCVWVYVCAVVDNAVVIFFSHSGVVFFFVQWIQVLHDLKSGFEGKYAHNPTADKMTTTTTTSPSMIYMKHLSNGYKRCWAALQQRLQWLYVCGFRLDKQTCKRMHRKSTHKHNNWHA